MMHDYRGLVPCLMSERKHNPGLSQMSLEFVVRGNGKVSAVKVNGQKGGFASCVLLAHADLPEVQRQQDDRQLVDVDAVRRLRRPRGAGRQSPLPKYRGAFLGLRGGGDLEAEHVLVGEREALVLAVPGGTRTSLLPHRCGRRGQRRGELVGAEMKQAAAVLVKKKASVPRPGPRSCPPGR